jgi:hypothetical protein
MVTYEVLDIVVIGEDPLRLQQLVVLRHHILRPHHAIIKNVVITSIAPNEEIGVKFIVIESLGQEVELGHDHWVVVLKGKLGVIFPLELWV